MTTGGGKIQSNIFRLCSWEINFNSEVILTKFHNKSNMYHLI